MTPAMRVFAILLLALSAGCAGVKEAPRNLTSAQLEPLMVHPALIGSGPSGTKESGTKEKAAAVATPLRPQVQEVQPQAIIAPALPAPAPSAPLAPAMTGGVTIGTEPVASAPALLALSRSPSAPRTATPPAKVSAAPVVIAQLPKNADPLPAARTPAPAPVPPLDVAALKARLRDTDAIGVFTKLALGNQVDDLLKQFRQHHQSGDKAGVASLREPYNILVLKVLALVQDGDPSLARTISASREAIWAILADPEKFLAVHLNGNATTRSSA
jgi:hypothetical protein